MSLEQPRNSSGFAPLRVRDFRLLFIGFAIGQSLMPLQFVTQIFWVQENAPEDIKLLLIALIGASRGLGSITFGLYGGALADRFDRRMLLLVTQVVLLTTTLALSVLMFVSDGGPLGLTLFFILTFAAAAMFAVDAPTRLAIVPDLLGQRLTPAGMSLNQAAGQISMPVAIFATGFIIHGFGFGGAYLLSTLGHVVEIAAVLVMTYRTDFRGRERSGSYGFKQMVRDVRDGVKYTRRQPVVFWMIILIAAMMGLGFPATANLGPTWVTEVVGVSIKNFGYVAMTWGLGAFFAAALLARFSMFERKGMLVAIGTITFAVAFVVFVTGHTVANAVIGNLGLGIGMSTSVVAATILIQHLVSNDMRGRVMSLFQLNMGFAQIMTLPVAIVAQATSMEVLFPILAFTVLGIVLLILVSQRQIWRAVIPRSELPNPAASDAAAGN